MRIRHHLIPALATLLTLVVATACSGPAPDAGRPESAANPAPGDSETQAITLTDANLAAYARALAKQAEIIRRPGRGSHYGVRISAYDSDGESGEVLEAAGMTVEEYQAVDALVNPILATLNFQGHIGPPRSIDVDAAPEWKQRLDSHAFADLSPESAAALRRNLETVAKPWGEIVELTAQHGR